MLVCGQVTEENQKNFAARVEAINKQNGPFDCLFALDLPSEVSIEGKTVWYVKITFGAAPLPIYFLTATESERTASGPPEEVAQNIYKLRGCAGVCKLPNGLNVVWVNGNIQSPALIHNILQKCPSSPSTYGCDVLLLTQWPKGLTKNTKESPPVSEDFGSDSAAELTQKVVPKYIFAGGSLSSYYEHPPYYSNSQTKNLVTRFYHLAPAFNTSKQKYLYAFNSKPVAESGVEDNSSITALAFPWGANINNNNNTDSKKRTLDGDDRFTGSYASSSSSGSGYNRWGLTNQQVSTYNEGGGSKRSKGSVPVPTENDTSSCWFCLSNPSADVQLVASVGDQFYVALDKGGLTNFHSLLIPIEHIQSSQQLSKNASDELEKYITALSKWSEDRDEVLILFEQYLPSRNISRHLLIQVVSVSKSVFAKASDEIGDDGSQGFEREGKRLKLSWKRFPPDTKLNKVIPSTGHYLLVVLPDVILMAPVTTQKVPISFLREVVANDILQQPERADWKRCCVLKDQEVQKTDDFKASFKPYDFTLG